jgi:uncharacterized delta-60 repeat protein
MIGVSLVKRLLSRCVFTAVVLFFLRSAVFAQGSSSFFEAPAMTAGQALPFTALQPNGQVLLSMGTLRFNADGTQDSSYSLQTPGTQFAVDSTGRIVVLGSALTQCDPNGSTNFVLYGNGSQVQGFIIQPDNRVVLWGGLLTFGSTTLPGIARVNTDGTLDTSFNPGFGISSGSISAVAVQAGGKLLVIGSFSSFDNVTVPGFVRLNTDGTVDSTFQPQLVTGGEFISRAQNILPLSNGTILVWDEINLRLQILNADGSLNTFLGTTTGGSTNIYGTNGNVDALAQQPDGKLLVAGSFYTFAGQPVLNLFRLNTDGTVDNTFDPSATIANLVQNTPSSIEIKSLALASGGQIYIGFGSNVLRLLPNGAPDLTFTPGPSIPGSIVAVAQAANGRIIVAGNFIAVGGVQRLGLAALLADGTVDPSFVPSAGVNWTQPPLSQSGSQSASLAPLADGSVLLSGTFSGIGGVGQSGAVHILSDGTLDSAFSPTLNAGGSIGAVAGLPGGLWVVGGSFTSINGSSRGNLAAFSSATQLDPSFGVVDVSGLNGKATVLQARPSGGLYVGGSFSLVGSSRAESLVALNSDGTLDSSFVPPNSTGSPLALAPMADGRLMVSNGTTLQRLTASGTLDTTVTLPNILPANAPNGYTLSSTSIAGITVDSEGRTYATIWFIAAPSPPFESYIETAVYRFDLAGNVDPTFIANGVLFGAPVYDNGGRTVASYETPAALAFGPNGLLSIAGNFGSFGSSSADSLVLIPQADQSGTVAPPVVTAVSAPPTQVIYAGGTVTLSVTASGEYLTYQWQLNGVPIPRANQSSLTISDVSPANAGTYTVLVTDPAGSVTSSPMQVSVLATRIVNLSARANVGTSGNILIAGFVIEGTGSKSILLRGVGPTLATAPFDVPGTLAQPQLTLISSTDTTLATNAIWGGSQTLSNAFSQVGAFALPATSADSAILTDVAVGSYTCQLAGVNTTTGVALAEIYDADSGVSTAYLENISARADVGSAANILIAGFVIEGIQPIQVLLRGVGPTLGTSPFNVPGVLAQPSIGLYDAKGTLVASDSGWGNSPVAGGSASGASARQASAADMSGAGAFALPIGSADSAMVATLPPGSYTLQLSGVNGSTGVGLVEVYVAP